MMNYDELRKSFRLVRDALKMLEEAELLNGQPLYYDETGNYVEVLGCLKHTLECQRESLEEDGEFRDEDAAVGSKMGEALRLADEARQLLKRVDKILMDDIRPEPTDA